MIIYKIPNIHKLEDKCLIPWDKALQTPFTLESVVLRPFIKTEPHSHSEYEIWLILNGNAIVQAGGRFIKVTQGDVIYLPPEEQHSIFNCANKNLIFISIYWK